MCPNINLSQQRSTSRLSLSPPSLSCRFALLKQGLLVPPDDQQALLPLQYMLNVSVLVPVTVFPYPRQE